MIQQSLTVREVLRYANHDFANQLHLIGMYIDMGQATQAKVLIEQLSEQYKQSSQLNKIGLPKTIEWLQTMNWRFSIFKTTFSVNVTEPLSVQWDEQFIVYLEKTILHVSDLVDAFTEQQLEIDIAGAAEHFQLSLKFTGKFEALPHLNTEWKDVHIETCAQSETMWHVIWRDREWKNVCRSRKDLR